MSDPAARPGRLGVGVVGGHDVAPDAGVERGADGVGVVAEGAGVDRHAGFRFGF